MDFCYTFEKTVKNYIEKYQMISKKEHILVGVSGGADSLCLLEVLHCLSKKEDWKITAVHIHHGIRGKEADQDEEFVKKFCKERTIPCMVYHCNVPLEAKLTKKGEEETARRLRYQSFSEAKLTLNADKIALAHHKDDQAETILFHLIRGSSFLGLCGMQPINQDKIRPFLCVERKEICCYLKEKEISYRTDRSNFSEKYARNKLRLCVFPLLEQINAKTSYHMAKTAEQMLEAENYFKEQTMAALKRIGLCHDGIWQDEPLYIEKKVYEQEPYVIRKRVLYEAVCHLANSKKDIEEHHILEFDQLFSKQSGKRLQLPYHLLAKRDFFGVRLEKIKKEELNENNIKFFLFSEQERAYIEQMRIYHPEKFPLSGEKELSKQIGQITWKLFFSEKNMIIPKNTYTKWFDYDKIAKALFRTRRAGDWFILNASGKHKKLKQYFIDEKIPKEQRERVLLLANGSHIIWIVGGRISEEYKIGEITKMVLELQFLRRRME